MPGTKDFQGRLLISLTDGANLGEVKDLSLNADITSVTGVHIGKEGIINRKTLTLPINTVKLFGKDAWLIDGDDDSVLREDNPTAPLAGSYKGREIQTAGGTKIGLIQDIVIDEKQQVVGFSLSKVFAQGPLSESKLVPRAAITSLSSGDLPLIADLEVAEKNQSA